MWWLGNLLSNALLARVLPRSRKKLPSDAPQAGLPDECRTRAELSDHCLCLAVECLGIGTPSQPSSPDNERGNEPSQAYRQDLPQHADATYMNLRTTQGYPERKGLGQLAANALGGAESP